ncbi:MAG: hypothetical protein KAI83_13675 [Thiomargarita sp.]|nr:hypothetical protein [Thiomargarita sp.]
MLASHQLMALILYLLKRWTQKKSNALALDSIIFDYASVITAIITNESESLLPVVLMLWLQYA